MAKLIWNLTTWVFYYEKDNIEYVLAEHDCKFPKSTKFWKQLKGMDNIERYGCRRKDSRS